MTTRHFRHIRARRRRGWSDPAQLDATIDALARNHIGACYGDRSPGAIPVSVFANPRVRRAFGLEAPVDSESPLPTDADVRWGDDDEEPRTAAERQRAAVDRARIAARWAAHGTWERVPWAAGHVGRAIRLVARTLGLTPLDAQILQLVIAGTVSGGLAGLLGMAPALRREDLVEVVANALARRSRDVRPRLAGAAPLLGTGLVQFDPTMEAFPGSGWLVRADPRLVSLVFEGGLRRERLLARFLSPEAGPTVGLEDFAHLKTDLDAVRRILDGALRDRRDGVNVLFHGPSGVGKTEVARLLAADLGAELFAASAADEDGNSLSPEQRLASLRVGHRLLGAARALLVFDELEDLDPDRAFRSGGDLTRVSKLWMNRLMEENPAPTLWITNSLQAVDPAFLRRFTFVLRFPALGAPQRRGVWARVAKGELSDAQLDELASTYDVSPGEIASAVRAARSAGEGTIDRGLLDRILAAAVRVTGRRPAPAVRAGREYRLEAVNASVDLVRLEERLCAWTPGAGAGVSICIYGRSGTGKSEWVHHLARRMGRPLVVRGVSDLESMWVGETERNIAEAFDEAAQQDAVLLFDECDWLLADRRGAVHSWEQTRVNEMLQQLEAFRGVVACTTNLFRSLDQAVLRRFVHKLEFRPLRPEQALLLWDAHLARFLPAVAAPPPALAAELRRIGDLTPGDFAVVARRVTQLGGDWTAEALLRELAAEAAAREGEARPIGF